MMAQQRRKHFQSLGRGETLVVWFLVTRWFLVPWNSASVYWSGKSHSSAPNWLELAQLVRRWMGTGRAAAEREKK